MSDTTLSRINGRLNSAAADRLNDIPTTQAQLGNVGRTTLFALLRSGELGSVKVGRRRMVPQSSIDAYIARLTRV